MKQTCPYCLHKCTWESQPLIHNVPAGNLLLSAGILFAGASPTKVLRVLLHVNIKAITPRTFVNHAKDFLYPTIWHVWKNEQEALFEQLASMDGGLILGGDGRADSPGRKKSLSLSCHC